MKDERKRKNNEMINFFMQFLAAQKYYARKKLRARTGRHHDRVRQRNMKGKKKKKNKKEEFARKYFSIFQRNMKFG